MKSVVWYHSLQSTQLTQFEGFEKPLSAFSVIPVMSLMNLFSLSLCAWPWDVWVKVGIRTQKSSRYLTDRRAAGGPSSCRWYCDRMALIYSSQLQHLFSLAQAQPSYSSLVSCFGNGRMGFQNHCTDGTPLWICLHCYHGHKGVLLNFFNIGCEAILWTSLLATL